MEARISNVNSVYIRNGADPSAILCTRIYSRIYHRIYQREYTLAIKYGANKKILKLTLMVNCFMQ